LSSKLLKLDPEYKILEYKIVYSYYNIVAGVVSLQVKEGR